MSPSAMRTFLQGVRLVALTVALLAAWEARATTVTPIDVTCPVCGTKIRALAIMSTNTFGGYDADLLQRARGTQPVTILPIACTSCYYAGYQSDFDKDVKVPAEVKTKLRKGLKPPVKIRNDGKSTDVPCWARYDLIAQRYTLTGEPAENLGMCYLRCAWSVRLTADLSEAALSEADQDRVEAIIKKLEKQEEARPENEAEYRIQLATQLSGYADAAPQEEKLVVGFAALRLLREHGEHALAEEALGRLRKSMEAARYQKIEKQVRQSIQLEQGYQQKALETFEKLAKDKSQKDRPVFLYLCGELNRRLGRLPEALTWYDQAAAVEGPKWLGKLVKKQRSIAASSKPAAAKDGTQ